MENDKNQIRLSFKSRHKSIASLPNTVLPPFTILTGVNGSGKTHLIQAISGGQVTVEGISPGNNSIQPFDWNNFSPQVDDGANPASMRVNRENALNTLITHRNNVWNQLASFFDQRHLSGDSKFQDSALMLKIDEATLYGLLKNCKQLNSPNPMPEHQARQFATHFIQHRNAIESQFYQQLRQYGDLEKELKECVRQLGVSTIYDLPESAFREFMPLNWTGNNFLQFQFASWFAAWHGAWEYNRINRFYATQEGETHRHYLTDENFVKRFGPKPWELTNRVLEASGIRYRVNHPATSFQNLEMRFNLRFADPADRIEIQVGDLSSGEKIILAIILLLYQTSGEMGLAQMPKLLLLDEVDAPLHPSYTKVLIDILNNELVAKHGLKIILTTHSPSTVALAPKGTIFEVVRDPRQIRPITPSQATQILSSGFVSITPSDVIVITESSDDPEYFQQVFSSCSEQGWLPAIPSLKFIAASQKDDDGMGGGCPQVKNWAPKLHEIGLERFRGLVDRDSGNKEDKIVKVLTRHSVENYIYDPLTLCAFLVHKIIDVPFPDLPVERMSATALLKLDVLQLQKMVDDFSEWFANKSGTAEILKSKFAPARYARLPEINIQQWWFDTKGHELETLLKKHLNPLCKQQQRGALIRNERDEIIAFQTKTFPEAISRDLIEIFSQLQISA